MAEVATYKTSYNSGARDVQFHPTEPDKFASAYEQNTIEVWDMRASATRAARKFINAHQDPVYTIDFSADGTYLASGSRDRTVKVRSRPGSCWLARPPTERAGPASALAVAARGRSGTAVLTSTTS